MEKMVESGFMSYYGTAVAVAPSVERPFKGPSKMCNSLTWVRIPVTAQGGRRKVLAGPSMGECRSWLTIFKSCGFESMPLFQ